MSPAARRRARVWRRDGPHTRCRWCKVPLWDVVRGSPPKRRNAEMATLEHMTPRAMGGTDALDNLVLACNRCNQARGASAGPAPLPSIAESRSWQPE